MGYLCCVLVIGLPSNLLVLRQLLAQYSAARKDTVKVSLGIVPPTNIIRFTGKLSPPQAQSEYLWPHASSNIFTRKAPLALLLWMEMGRFLMQVSEFHSRWVEKKCYFRLYNFFSMLCLYKSSNIIVCIALDRLRTVLSASKIRGKRDTVGRRL